MWNKIKRIFKYLYQPLSNEDGVFGIDDAFMIASILSMATGAASQMGAFGSSGSGGVAAGGRPTTGKSTPFQVTNPYQGRPLLGATGRLSEELTDEEIAIPKYGRGQSMTPFNQNNLNQKITSATRGK